MRDFTQEDQRDYQDIKPFDEEELAKIAEDKDKYFVVITGLDVQEYYNPVCSCILFDGSGDSIGCWSIYFKDTTATLNFFDNFIEGFPNSIDNNYKSLLNVKKYCHDHYMEEIQPLEKEDNIKF